MIGEDSAVTIPKSTRQNGVCKKTVTALDNQKNLHAKYRWLWMMKSSEETVWYVNAPQEIHSPFDTAIRLFVEFTTVAAYVLWKTLLLMALILA